MKLKLVVASMSVLGLVSCPVIADAANQAKKSHKVMKHHTMRHVNYKDEGNLPMQPVADVCSMSQAARTMDEMTQSIGRSMPNPCNAGWFNRVQFSGGINMDVGKWGNRNANYMGENYQRLSLNDAYLNVGANVNDWVKAFASMSYNTASITAPTTAVPGLGILKGAEYSAAYSNNVIAGGVSTFQVEQAYATFGNIDREPFFVQVGKQFQDFGRYNIHPITRTMTQSMSETLATSAKLGFISNGFHGSVAVFDDPMAKVTATARPTNYVAGLGFNQDNRDLGWDAGVGYIHNMLGVNDIAYQVNEFTGLAGYNSRKSGWSLHGDVNSGPFTIGARYVSALQRFNILDLPRNGTAALSTTGAKPYSYGLNAGYGFNAMNYNQNVYVGYEASREAAGLMLPRTRWTLGLNADVYANTNLGIQLDRDHAYSVANGGTGRNTNLISLRAAVKFG